MLKPESQSNSISILGQSPNSNFFSSGLRQKVDQLMNVLWAGGVNNPMDSIEQLSYLVFLRLLSDRDEQAAHIEKGFQRIFSGEWSRYAWGNFVTLTGNELFDTLRGAIEKLHELPGLSPTGKMLFRNATLKIYDRPTLRAVVQIIAEMDLAPHEGHDLKGDMYEYLLSKLSQSGTNGQFRTPRHIIDLIVALVDPQPGMRICDPACGTAGFLIASYMHILRHHTKPADLTRGILDGSQLKPKQWEFLEQHAFNGFDNDANMVKIAILNLYLHQLERARIEHHNPLTSTQGGQYPGPRFDVILANPPFAGRVQKESILADINLDTRDTELLFLKWFLDHLLENGRAGVIVPNGVLFGSGKADRKLRELLLTTCDLQAIITLPSGVFKPYSGVGTAIFVFQKGRATSSVWFYELTADGYSLDDKRVSIESNDIPDIFAKWPERVESAQSYRVAIDEIRKKDWSLSPERYRPFSPSPTRFRAPSTILPEMLHLLETATSRAKALLQRGNVSLQPIDWPSIALEDIATVKAGFAWRSEFFTKESSAGPAVIRIQNLGSNDNAQLVYYTGDIEQGYWIDAGEILVSLSGSFKAYRWNGPRALLNQRIVVIRPKPIINDRFLFYQITLRLEEIERAAVGIAVANASMGTVREMKVKLPPLEVQEQIVVALNEVEELRSLHGKNALVLEELFRSILHRAFHGEL